MPTFYLLPVHWIHTLDLLFTTFNFECIVELGPLPTLTGMVTLFAACDLRFEMLTFHFHTVSDVLARHKFIFCVSPQCMNSSPKIFVSLLLQTSQVLVQWSYVT